MLCYQLALIYNETCSYSRVQNPNFAIFVPQLSVLFALHPN